MNKNRRIHGKTDLLEMGIFNNGRGLIDGHLQTADGERAFSLVGSEPGQAVIFTWHEAAPAKGPWTLTLARRFSRRLGVDVTVYVREVVTKYTEQTWLVT